ncbi:MAG: hypothetical protein IJ391_08415 [Clostridia bacterium]|nr:hypothetical protein [Clostridia bacterium]
MKVCIVQPPYSMDAAPAEENFAKKLEYLAQCDSSMDVIVLPEYSDVPYAAASKVENLDVHNSNIEVLLSAARDTAIRCGAVVFVNALCKLEEGYRNTTYAYGRDGQLIGRYYKRHLPPSELYTLELDHSYIDEFSEPYVLEYEGVRYAFLTCYDFYFYEAFPTIARQNVDIIIGCSLQRSDSHSALEIIGRFLSYNTNAYLVRSSVSLGEDSPICGSSMVVAPNGDILANMLSRTGLECVEIDPKKKYYKPAGFGGREAAHYEYIEFGRRPWLYRPAGSAIALTDDAMPYPRICAHRGFSSVAPENSMPAFGAAVALGAHEIEFDLWCTSDGEIVSCHDDTLDRVSDGTGKIYEHTYDELKKLDFGIKFGESYRGLRIVRFEEILKKFACHVVMNIHVKTLSDEYDIAAIRKIVSLIRKYDCEKYVYFMITHDGVIKQFLEYAPDIPVCVGHDDKHPWEIVERAIKLGAKKVQLFKPYFDKSTVDKAHANGILCNVFYADEPDEAKKYIDMGIDTILTNEYNIISQAVLTNE